MKPNMGKLDRVIRILVGLALLGFAVGLVFPNTGWNWIGSIGVVPLLTALVRFCPAYNMLGISTGR
jgi:hypothetical protein